MLNNTWFERAITDMYPPEPQLQNTTESPTALLYLVVLITINNGKYSTTVYSKRESFQFDVINFPHLSSNIPAKPAYVVYISQLVRIGRVCSTFVQFKERHYKLTQKLIRQGFWYSGLCVAFKRFTKTHYVHRRRHPCKAFRNLAVPLHCLGSSVSAWNTVCCGFK